MQVSPELINFVGIVFTAFVGVATLYVAVKQYRLEQRQAKLEQRQAKLEQRRARAEIYTTLHATIDAVLALLTAVTQDEVPREAITEFAKALSKATPFFEDDQMIDYLNQLRFHAMYLRLQQQRVVRPDLSDEEREQIKTEINNTLEWLVKQEGEAMSRFRDYLPG